MTHRHSLGTTLAALIGLSACGPLPPIQSEPPASTRDLLAFGGQLEAAGVANTAPYQPQLGVEDCFDRPLPVALISDQLAAAAERAQSYSDAHKGTGLIVMKDGAIVYEQYSGEGGQDVPTNSYSMHKSLLGLAVGVAIDMGIIRSIDTPVGDLIAEWRNDPRGEIPLERFLRMESGLLLSSMNSGGNRVLELNIGEYIDAHALVTPVANPAGSVFRYSNVDSQIVGIALSRALEKQGYGDYASFLSSTIWCPIGAGKAALWLDREGGSPHYFAGMFTTLRSWARVGELIRTGGQVEGKAVIPSSWIDIMVSPSQTNANYGVQVWLGSPWVEQRRYNEHNPISITHEQPYLADDVVFFDGFGGQRVYVIASQGITIVRTGNIDLTYDDSVIVNLILQATEN